MGQDDDPFSAVPALCGFYKKLPSEIMGMNSIPEYNMAVEAMNEHGRQESGQ